MNKKHQEILNKIKEYSGKGTSETASYLGSNHVHCGVSVPQRRKIAKAWKKSVSLKLSKKLKKCFHKKLLF